MKAIDPKYSTDGTCIFKKVSGEIIPDDEPVMLFRARDYLAIGALYRYRDLCVEAGCSAEHIGGIIERMEAFHYFSQDHPERMKKPG